MKSTNTQRVLRANAALIKRGGRRMPSGYLQPDAAKVLAELVTSGYGPSPVAVIVCALFDAHKKMARSSAHDVELVDGMPWL